MILTNIQKYCIHDGNGIRTTAFFKGCPLQCSWCHNPETQRIQPEARWFKDRCAGCGTCEAVCPAKAISMEEGRVTIDRTLCTGCGTCSEACINQAIERVGENYTPKELIRKLAKDQMFYEESGGGVTLSGGEVMTAPMEELMALVKGLDKEGISVDIDTCGYCSYHKLEKLLPYVDTFLYDIKVLDSEWHRYFTRVDNTLILDNLKKLSRDGAKIWIRVPVICKVNADSTFFDQLGSWLKAEKISVRQINLIAYHDYGADKYVQLGRTYEKENFEEPTSEELEKYKAQLEQMGFQVKIGG